MHVTFENELGKIEMGGGNHQKVNIREITGLSLPEKNYNVVTYAGQSGQETISEAAAARTITIGGDIRGRLQKETTRMARILNRPGTLFIHSGNKHRRIPCRCTAFDISERQGRIIQCFAMQFTADDPAFLDQENKQIAVFQRTDQIKGTFTFPLVFTVRKTEADIVNMGDCETEPVFTITSSGATVTGDDYGVEITNETTGSTIFLKYRMSADETVTIDIPNRTITSDQPSDENQNGNLINYISDNTFLSAFQLSLGTNHIKAVDHNQSANFDVVCEYSNKYIEAVV